MHVWILIQDFNAVSKPHISNHLGLYGDTSPLPDYAADQPKCSPTDLVLARAGVIYLRCVFEGCSSTAGESST